MQIIQWQFTFAFARTARVTPCVEILKMFERHFASFKWQKLLVIVELERQSMTYSVGCLTVAYCVKVRFGLFFIVRTIAKPANRIVEKSLSIISSSKLTNGIVQNLYRHLKVRTACSPVKSFGILASHGKRLSRPRLNYFFLFWVFPIMILFRLGLAFS